jgi:hypothetical protein
MKLNRQAAKAKIDVQKYGKRSACLQPEAGIVLACTCMA